MFKNVTSQKIALFAFDTTTGAAKTGDAANITAYVSKDHGSVTVLGDTSATEMDATNAKGWYLFDVTQTETNADTLLFTGKSSTANISIVGRPIFTRPPNHSALSIDSNGRVDVIKVAGTTQTAGDLATLITAVDDFVDTEVAAIKAKTDQLTFTTANRVDSQVFGMQADTVTASAIATDAIGSAELAASAVTEIQSGLSTLDAAAVRTAVGLASANLDTQLGTIDDFIDTEVSAIKAKTDNLPASPAAVSDIPTANTNADALLDRAAGVETNRTLRQALRLILAVCTGKASGLNTTTATYRDTNDSKNRVVATVDVDGNRSAVTYDAS